MTASTPRPAPAADRALPLAIAASLIGCAVLALVVAGHALAGTAPGLGTAGALAATVGAITALAVGLGLLLRLRAPAEPPAPALPGRPAGATERMLALQQRLLDGLPGPAMLLRPGEHGGWQWLAANEAARATLPARGGAALDAVVADLVAEAEASPAARARRLDLPDGGCIVWLPPSATPPQAAVPPAPAPRTPLPRPASPATAPAPAPDDDDRAAIVYTVSHDLRAPIRVVEGFTRIVREDYGHLLDRVGNDHLDRVLGAATRMNSMIDALLALSRLSTQALQEVDVDLSETARQVVAELRQQAPQRRVEVTIDPDLHATGDPTLLRMVLDNLLGNAWKYSARREVAHIEFGCRQEADGRPVFFVRDDGAGFDMRFAARLFGAFQRLHGATEFAGTGIGLASVRRIVRRHGGDIRAEAVVNQGATFYFTLGQTAPGSASCSSAPTTAAQV